jgi:hypothetical protein
MFLLPSKRGKYKKRELKDALGSLLFLYALYVMGHGVERRSADPRISGPPSPEQNTLPAPRDQGRISQLHASY